MAELHDLQLYKPKKAEELKVSSSTYLHVIEVHLCMMHSEAFWQIEIDHLNKCTDLCFSVFPISQWHKRDSCSLNNRVYF